MSKHEIIRAWLDEEYRAGLTDAQRAALPGHPAGLIELDTVMLEAVAGGACPTITRQPTNRTVIEGCGDCL